MLHDYTISIKQTIFVEIMFRKNFLTKMKIALIDNRQLHH